MPAILQKTTEDNPVFRTLFPDWSDPRPLAFFFMEELLEARSRSVFPTGAVEFDEDVNIYLAHLLTRLTREALPAGTRSGSLPQWHPPAKDLGKQARSRWYLAQGEQRLLYLGLFDRGEGCRRRSELWGMSREETRRRDMVCGKTCYQAAADLMESTGDPPPLAPVVAKLARHFDDYVQVLRTLATDRWNFGARLSDRQLAELLPPRPSASL